MLITVPCKSIDTLDFFFHFSDYDHKQSILLSFYVVEQEREVKRKWSNVFAANRAAKLFFFAYLDNIL